MAAWLGGEGGALVGIAVVGRPGARALQDGLTMEVARLCSDGKLNGCSMLYGAARRAGVAKGYRRGLAVPLARTWSQQECALSAEHWQAPNRGHVSLRKGRLAGTQNRRNAAVYAPFWGYRNCHLELYPQISPRMRRTLTPPYGTCETKSPTNDAILRIPDEVR
ncbi:XF1762 family protein [Sphingomonas aerolata]|uniref:XF1762 family protein n=1 Tax=Sphingomonas aerolata TaxID=185951 RepID=UPI002FE280A4